MTRKLAALAALVAALAACAGDREERTEPLRVGIVFDIGGRGDGGFNDDAAAGAQRAVREGGVTVEYAEAQRGDGGDPMARFAGKGMDLVIAVGFLASHDATLVARRFPNVGFAVIDYALPSDADGRAMLPPPNLAGLNFREEEGAYLVGALAALTSRSGTVGFVGGMTSPLIAKFEAGYAAGVRRACARCEVLAAYAGRTPDAFRAPDTGYRLARAQYAAGADVVFHASGETGAGVFRAARETGRLAIGVDVDQSSQAPGLVLSSMVKRMDVAVHDVIREAKAGRFRGGIRSYGLGENGIGYVWDDRSAALSPPGARARVETLRAAVTAGLIEVPSALR